MRAMSYDLIGHLKKLSKTESADINNSPIYFLFEPAHDKTYKMAWAPSEDRSAFGVRMKKNAWFLSYPMSA